jgi:hypothetical protein
MKRHNGMRPQDVVLLLKIIAIGHDDWRMKDLAQEVGISASEVTESLERSAFAGLIADDKRRVMRAALLEFLVHGIRYVFPVRPAGMILGLATAHAASPLSDQIVAAQKYVWPFPDGKDQGIMVEPLIGSVPMACLRDAALYEMLALVEALRVGKARERNIAEVELEKRIWKEVQPVA